MELNKPGIKLGQYQCFPISPSWAAARQRAFSALIMSSILKGLAGALAPHSLARFWHGWPSLSPHWLDYQGWQLPSPVVLKWNFSKVPSQTVATDCCGGREPCFLGQRFCVSCLYLPAHPRKLCAWRDWFGWRHSVIHMWACTTFKTLLLSQSSWFFRLGLKQAADLCISRTGRMMCDVIPV